MKLRKFWSVGRGARRGRPLGFATALLSNNLAIHTIPPGIEKFKMQHCLRSLECNIVADWERHLQSLQLHVQLHSFTERQKHNQMLPTVCIFTTRQRSCGEVMFSAVVFFSVSLSVHMRDPHVTTTVWLKALSFFKQVTQAVTCPRFSREEASTTKVVVLTYYFAIFFAETAWKWNNLDSGGGSTRPWHPLGSADDKNYTKKIRLLQKTKVR